MSSDTIPDGWPPPPDPVHLAAADTGQWRAHVVTMLTTHHNLHGVQCRINNTTTDSLRVAAAQHSDGRRTRARLCFGIAALAALLTVQALLLGLTADRVTALEQAARDADRAQQSALPVDPGEGTAPSPGSLPEEER